MPGFMVRLPPVTLMPVYTPGLIVSDPELRFTRFWRLLTLGTGNPASGSARTGPATGVGVMVELSMVPHLPTTRTLPATILLVFRIAKPEFTCTRPETTMLELPDRERAVPAAVFSSKAEETTVTVTLPLLARKVLSPP